MSSRLFSRRELLLGASSSLVSAFSIPAFAQADVPYLPYLPTWTIPWALADCARLKQMISEAQSQLDAINAGDNEPVDQFIRRVVKARDELDAELTRTSNAIDKLDNAQVLGAIGIVLGATFLIAGAVVTTPAAVGALAGLAIVSGTTLWGLQVIYTQDTTATLAFGYSKDRLFVFGEPMAEAAGSTGGQLLLKSLSIVALVADLVGVASKRNDRAILEARFSAIWTEANAISRTLRRYKPGDRAPWKAIMTNELTATILRLQQTIERTSATNCLIEVREGPILKRG